MGDPGATTEGMKSGGYYDDHSEYQRATAASGARLIAELVAAAPLPAGDRMFVIADYGSSTGRNSAASVRMAVDAVRARRAGQRVAVIHNDLPTNDWNELFANVAAAPDGYAHAAGAPVLPLASAVSFFDPAAPSASVHLGISFSAAHWLRTQPDLVLDAGFYFSEATGDLRAALAARAAADWLAFLSARAADLAPKGRLLVQMVGTDETGAADGSRVTARKLMLAMSEVAKELVAEGKLDPALTDSYVLPVYARTPSEATAPLQGQDAPLRDLFAVIECRTDPVANPYLEQWRADRDATAYGRSYSAFVRAFTESSLREHLFAAGARTGGGDALIDEYFERLSERFAADPERDAFEDWTLTVALARR
jgi:cyclopropane-fatty-acyl-phospholipid synthase